MEDAFLNAVAGLGVAGVLAIMLFIHLFWIVPRKEEAAMAERERLVAAFQEESEKQRQLFREEQAEARQQHESMIDRLIAAITKE